VLIGAVIAATAVALLTAPHPAGDDVAAGRVVVLLAPDLAWDCVDRAASPALTELVDHAALGSLSMQTAGGDTSPVAVAATISAGARTSDTPEGAGTLPLTAVPSNTVGAEDYRVEPNRWAALTRRAGDAGYGARPGALGSSTEVALIDAAVPGSDGHRDDPTAAMAVDLDGVLSKRSVGVPGDGTATASGLAGALDATADIPVVMVALPAASDATGGARASGADRCDAQTRAWDPLIARVRSHVDTHRQALLLISSTTHTDPERLGVVALAAPDVGGGVLSTASTNAERFVTLPDVAPTILRALGEDPPAEMTGQPMTVIGADAGADAATVAATRRAVVDDGERAVVRDAAFPDVVAAWAVLAVAILLGCFAVTRLRFRRTPVEMLCLWSMSVPLVSFVVAPLEWQRWGSWGLWTVVVLGAMVVGGVAWWTTRRRPWVGVVTVMTATWLVLAAVGNVVQMSAIFGYSPIDGGRFAGFGNQAFLLLGWSALVICAVGRLGEPDRSCPAGSGPAAMAGLLVAGVIVDGFVGADVGGLLALIPTSVVAWYVFTGRPLRWRVILGAVVAAAAAVVAAALIDLSRPAEERTHLGRLADRLLNGSGRDVLERKVATMASTFVQLWAPVMVIAVGFFIWRLVRPSTRSLAIEAADPSLRPLGIAALTFAVLSALTNDSGLRMTAALVGLGVAHACWSTLAEGGYRDGDASEDDRAAQFTAATGSVGSVGSAGS